MMGLPGKISHGSDHHYVAFPQHLHLSYNSKKLSVLPSNWVILEVVFYEGAKIK